MPPEPPCTFLGFRYQLAVWHAVELQRSASEPRTSSQPAIWRRGMEHAGHIVLRADRVWGGCASPPRSPACTPSPARRANAVAQASSGCKTAKKDGGRALAGGRRAAETTDSRTGEGGVGLTFVTPLSRVAVRRRAKGRQHRFLPFFVFPYFFSFVFTWTGECRRPVHRRGTLADRRLGDPSCVRVVPAWGIGHRTSTRGAAAA